MNRKKIIIPLVVVLVLLLVWVFSGVEEGPVETVYVSPTLGQFDVTVTTSGELRAQNSTMIMGPAGARDVGVFNFTIQDMVPEGTQVEPGDYVAELDRTDLETRLQSAELELIAVEAQYEQALLDTSLQMSQARNNLEELQFQVEERQIEVEQSIYESPAVQRQAQIALDRSRLTLEQETSSYETRRLQMEAQLREIQTDLATARTNVQRIEALDSMFTITAPEAGMVVYYRSRNGQRRGIGSSFNAFDAIIAELPDFSSMESITFVNEVDIQKVQTGQQVTVGLDANKDKYVTGTVTSVANIGEQRPNSDARVFEVIIQLNEPDMTLRPTMTTSNEIKVDTVEEALYVPLETVYTIGEEQFVYKQTGSGMVLQQVITGVSNDNDIVIREGLTIDDRVLITMAPDPEELDRDMLPEEVIEQHRLEMEELERQRQEELRALQQQMAARDSLRNRMRQQQPQQGQGGMQFNGEFNIQDFDFENFTPPPGGFQGFPGGGGGNFGGGNFGGARPGGGG